MELFSFRKILVFGLHFLVMVLEDTFCENCNYNGRKTDDYCPKCGEKDPWVFKALHKFDEDDLPIIFDCTFSHKSHELWYALTKSYFGEALEREDVGNLPSDMPYMKKEEVTLYYILKENLEIDGPYLYESEAKRYS